MSKDEEDKYDAAEKFTQTGGIVINPAPVSDDVQELRDKEVEEQANKALDRLMKEDLQGNLADTEDKYDPMDKFTQPAGGVREAGTGPTPEEIDRMARERAAELLGAEDKDD